MAHEEIRVLLRLYLLPNYYYDDERPSVDGRYIFLPGPHDDTFTPYRRELFAE